MARLTPNAVCPDCGAEFSRASLRAALAAEQRLQCLLPSRGSPPPGTAAPLDFQHGCSRSRSGLRPQEAAPVALAGVPDRGPATVDHPENARRSPTSPGATSATAWTAFARAPAIRSSRPPGAPFTCACNARWSFRTVTGACRLAPVPRVPASFPTFLSI